MYATAQTFTPKCLVHISVRSMTIIIVIWRKWSVKFSQVQLEIHVLKNVDELHRLWLKSKLTITTKISLKETKKQQKSNNKQTKQNRKIS